MTINDIMTAAIGTLVGLYGIAFIANAAGLSVIA